MGVIVTPPRRRVEIERKSIYLIHTHTWVNLGEITSVSFPVEGDATISLTNGRYVLAQGDDVAALRKALGIAG